MKIQNLLKSMGSWNASDLFLRVGAQPSARINGQVVDVEAEATSKEEMRAIVDEVMTPEQREKFRSSGDADVGYSLPSGDRFRLNFARSQGRISVVGRALPSGALGFESLGLPEEVAALAELSRGLVLVTGATGSGKSTTIAALIHRINQSRSVHVVTIEDPIEFVYREARARITQRELGGDTRSFHSALRSVVRQSPDVIVIGEMRDADTMRTALSAALTGHLVFATLHTVNASQTLQRILAYFPEYQRRQAAMDLSLSLKGVLSQRLIPRADDAGRVLALERLDITPGVQRLIREERVSEVEDLMRDRSDGSSVTFNRSLLRLYSVGAIDHATGMAYATNPDEFALAAQGMGTGASTFERKDTIGDAGFDMKSLLKLALAHGASDLHITIGRPPIFRIHGALRPLDSVPLSEADLRLLLFSVLTSSQRSKFELDREIDFAISLDKDNRFRVNAYFQRGKMAAALRAIPSQIPDAQELGIPNSVLRMGTRAQGLLLVVGPTGSGKSTTLACLIDRINAARRCRILTIEDPIEFTHTGKLATVDQREVHTDTNSFADALKYVLRQDPDVVLVGEMRDTETISAAITAAETGHLVLATLHTNDAVQAIDRIIDVFPSHAQSQVRSQLASALLGVVSQRLLSRSGGEGRIAAFEVMIANPAIRNIIRTEKTHQAIGVMETHIGDGMLTMDRSLAELVKAGLIDRDEAMRYATNPAAVDPTMARGTHRRR